MYISRVLSYAQKLISSSRFSLRYFTKCNNPNCRNPKCPKIYSEEIVKQREWNGSKKDVDNCKMVQTDDALLGAQKTKGAENVIPGFHTASSSTTIDNTKKTFERKRSSASGCEADDASPEKTKPLDWVDVEETRRRIAQSFVQSDTTKKTPPPASQESKRKQKKARLSSYGEAAISSHIAGKTKNATPTNETPNIKPSVKKPTTPAPITDATSTTSSIDAARQNKTSTASKKIQSLRRKIHVGHHKKENNNVEYSKQHDHAALWNFYKNPRCLVQKRAFKSNKPPFWLYTQDNPGITGPNQIHFRPKIKFIPDEINYWLSKYSKNNKITDFNRALFKHAGLLNIEIASKQCLQVNDLTVKGIMQCMSYSDEDDARDEEATCCKSWRTCEVESEIELPETDFLCEECILRDMDECERHKILEYFDLRCYKNPEYYMYDKYSYHDVHLYLQQCRVNHQSDCEDTCKCE